MNAGAGGIARIHVERAYADMSSAAALHERGLPRRAAELYRRAADELVAAAAIIAESAAGAGGRRRAVEAPTPESGSATLSGSGRRPARNSA